MTKEQIMLFDAKLDKLNAEDLLYFEGFKDCIQFMENNVFHNAEKDAYKMEDHTMRYPFTRLLYNMKDALEEKLVDELFRRMDQTIEGYKKIMDEPEEPEEAEENQDDYDIPDPDWMYCDDNCKNCTSDTCKYREVDTSLPESSIDFMNIGGEKND